MSTDLLSAPVITKIWKRMVAIYGHKWSSHLGDAMDGVELSEAAKTWQLGLTGVTVDQLGLGFQALISSGKDWPPSLTEFRKLCVSQGASVRSLNEVVSLLVLAKSRQGSLVARYRHPLVLAMAQDSEIDLFFLRTAKTVDARAHVRPVYEKLLSAGWADWPEHAFENTKGVGRDLPVPDKELGRKSFIGFRTALGMDRAEFA
ncbi:MAG: hypothetical protein ACXWT0_00075 [Methylobacter sp.]